MKRVCLLLALAACNTKAPPAPQAPAQATSSVTRWVEARNAAGVSMLEVPAEVRGDLATAGAVDVPYPARITRIFVKVGDKVERGDAIVAVIVPQVLTAAGAYVAAATRLEAQEARRARLNELQSEGLTRSSDTIENATRIADAKAERANALATLKAAGVEASQAAALLEHDGAITLRSPISGVVTSLDAAVGETREGSGRPIARVVGESGRRIEAHLVRTPPPDAGFALVARTGKTIPLTLVSMSPAVDPIDGARMAWLEAPADAELSVGSKERVRITLGNDVVLVPSTALVTRDEKTRVRRKDAWVDVEVVASSGADALVRGVKVGDAIALDGQRVADEEERPERASDD